jgi:hypothetical protein
VLTLRPRDRKPPVNGAALGAQVKPKAVRLTPAEAGPEPKVLINTKGLRSGSKDGTLEIPSTLAGSWSAVYSSNLAIEFELPESGPLNALEVWNYNGALLTTNGTSKLDVAVSDDGKSWRTVLRGVNLPEAPGVSAYDEPAVLKLDAVSAKWMRFENLAPFGGNTRVGLGRVVFHSNKK